MVPMVFRDCPCWMLLDIGADAEIQRASGQIDGGMLKDCFLRILFKKGWLLSSFCSHDDETILQYVSKFVLWNLEGEGKQSWEFTTQFSLERWSFTHEDFGGDLNQQNQQNQQNHASINDSLVSLVMEVIEAYWSILKLYIDQWSYHCWSIASLVVYCPWSMIRWSRTFRVLCMVCPSLPAKQLSWPLGPLVSTGRNRPLGGFQLVMGVPQKRWTVFVRENPNQKWMI